GPLAPGPHRVVGGMVLEHLEEVLLPARGDRDQRLAATPFVRTRPVSRSSWPSSSACPCRMVLGSHPRMRAMYSRPPWPSLAASMAAYRRRSCSRKESKSRFIFRSMSGAYASMIVSWRRTPKVKDRPSDRERTGKVIRDCSQGDARGLGHGGDVDREAPHIVQSRRKTE